MNTARPALLCTELPRLENTLLWAMRAWVIGHCHQKRVAHRIDAAFRHLGAHDATAYFNGFMGVLSSGATRMLDVNCVCCRDVSADESALLDIFAFQQAERHEEAYELLATMVVESAAPRGCDTANGLVLALRDAGHSLPRRALAKGGAPASISWPAVLAASRTKYMH